MEIRTERVQVKLAPGGAPDEVVFTAAERDAVLEAATACGYRHLSTFIRELCVQAVGGTQAVSIKDTLRKASADCGMRLGAWMRSVVLAAVGYEGEPSPLAQHQTAASGWYRATKRKAKR